MKITKTFAASLVLVAAVAAGGVVLAQSMPHGGHGKQGGMHESMHGKMKGGSGQKHGQGLDAANKGDQSASSLAFNAVNEKMHRDMAITFSGNPDADFARAMIPHHQGAIDMAKIVLAFGKDPEIRKLAEEVVRTQEAEVALMRDWLKKQNQ